MDVRLSVHMDRFLTATEARQQFLKLLEDIKEGEQVVITRRGKPAAIVIDFERHQLLAELARLWQDPQSLRLIRAAHEEARTGRVYRLKGMPTVKRLVQLASKKGILKRRSG
jgi:prevent-host-death family protein